MKNLTFILPVHVYDKVLLDNVLRNLSQFDCRTILVGPQNVYDSLVRDGISINFDFITNNDNTDFCSQVNLGVRECSTEYFTIVEYDDEFYPKWLDNFKKYSQVYDASAYLTIMEIMNDKKELVTINNELAWSTSFVNDLGYIDMDALNSFYDFNIVGGVFKRDAFIEVGGLKTSMDIASTYEFLMRFVDNNNRVFVIPKLGYRHMMGRDGSFMSESKKRLTQEHGEWLINTAKEEMKYKEDRKLKFTEN